jgi:quinoprotein glucose dehydrogenase
MASDIETRHGGGTKTAKLAKITKIYMSFVSFVAFVIFVTRPSAVSVRDDVQWPVNGGVDNIRYSALTQIDRENVSQLKVAWTYDSHDSFTGSEMQSNPIVVNGTLYITTPTLKVVALDAATGREIWKFDPSGGAAPGARFRHRGVAV